MIFLYRFEALEYDAALTVPVPGSMLDAAGTRRQVFTHTNYERTVFADTLALQAPMLPAGSNSFAAFTPLAIKHDGFKFDAERNSGQLVVVVPESHPVAQMFLYDAPGSQVWVTVAVKGEPGSEPLVVFVGRVGSAEFAVDGSAQVCELRCIPLSEVLSRDGLTRKHPRTCGHTLFDSYGCGLSRHQVDGGYWKYREDGVPAALSADGMTLTLPAAANRPDGWFTRGVVVLNGVYEANGLLTRARVLELGMSAGSLAGALAPNGGIRRSVAAHVGQQLTLDVALPEGLSLDGLTATVYAGCLKTPEACQSSKFANFVRYGGFTEIPVKNPYEVGIRS